MHTEIFLCITTYTLDTVTLDCTTPIAPLGQRPPIATQLSHSAVPSTQEVTEQEDTPEETERGAQG